MRRRLARFTRIRGLTPGQMLVRSTIACGAMAVILFGLNLRRIDPLPIDQTPPRFDAKRAHAWMTTLSKQFPHRVTWGEPRKKAALWLKSELKALGYQPQGMSFSETIAGKTYQDLENVWAEKRGSKFPNEIVVVAAHYDITDTTVEGAADDASGVGVVLELARLYRDLQPQRTILFLLTDSEEFGAFWGARAFARQFDRISQVVAVANFDFIVPEKQTGILTLCDGLQKGFTPLWLREIALNSIRSLGQVEALDLPHLAEFASRALQIPPSDHGAFLAAGIPAFNWVGQNPQFSRIMTQYHHTPKDRAEFLRVESFDAYGRAAERAVRSIDALNALPSDWRESDYWKISSLLALEGWVVKTLHLLSFIPFLIFGITKFQHVLKTRWRGRVVVVFRNEAKNLALTLGALLLGYVVILLLPQLRVIDLYETFPATQKSAILYNPNYLALGITLAAILGAYWLFRRLFSDKDDHFYDVGIRHAFHAFVLTVVILLAFLKNSSLAVLLLLPPAYLWTAIRVGKKIQDRLLNALLLLGGAITLVAMTVVMTSIFHVGVAYWYIFLSAAYGLISAYAVVLFMIAMAVMYRLLRAFVI